MSIDKKTFIKVSELKSSNIEDVDEIIQLSNESRSYLESKKWCKTINEEWFAIGWGNMLGVFFYEIEAMNADPIVWIIVGDLPSAFIDVESAVDESEAILRYVELMEDWIEDVENGGMAETCFPIGVAPTLEHASLLKKRTRIIREDILS